MYLHLTYLHFLFLNQSMLLPNCGLKCIPLSEKLNLLKNDSRQKQGRILGGGMTAPLLKFSAPPLRTFTPPLIILLTKYILKDNYSSLIKKYKMQT